VKNPAENGGPTKGQDGEQGKFGRKQAFSQFVNAFRDEILRCGPISRGFSRTSSWTSF
jgi:hypothetical protein